jgi:hypothetical protein
VIPPLAYNIRGRNEIQEEVIANLNQGGLSSPLAELE